MCHTRLFYSTVCRIQLGRCYWNCLLFASHHRGNAMLVMGNNPAAASLTILASLKDIYSSAAVDNTIIMMRVVGGPSNSGGVVTLASHSWSLVLGRGRPGFSCMSRSNQSTRSGAQALIRRDLAASDGAPRSRVLLRASCAKRFCRMGVPLHYLQYGSLAPAR